MEEFNLELSYDWFITALNRLDEKNLLLSDDLLLYEILEELDIENITFLHPISINPLIENNLLPESISIPVSELRAKLMNLIQEKGTVEQIRNDDEWNDVRQLAKELVNEVRKHNHE